MRKQRLQLSSRDIKLLTVLVCLAVFFTACLKFYPQYRGAVFTRRESWAKTSGRILSSAIAIERIRGRISWSPTILYAYQVDGETYSSNRIDFSIRTGSTNRRFAEEKIQQYPVNAQVVVFYLPADPRFSVLEPETRGYTVPAFFINIGGLSMSLAGIAAVLFRKRLQPESDNAQ